MSCVLISCKFITTVSFLNKQINDLGWGRESWVFCYRLLVILLFLFEGVSSSFGCFGNAAFILLWHSLGLPYNYFASAS